MNQESVAARSIAAGLIGFLATTAVATAQMSFDLPIAYLAGEDPHAVALADFDGDQDIDIAVTIHNPARLSLLRNQGDGTFGMPQYTTLPTNTAPAGLVAGDFNADGEIDLMVVFSGTNVVRYLRNLGDGDFVIGDYATVGTAPQHIVQADFDGDGDMDFAVTNRDSNGVSIVRNDGAGIFSWHSAVAVGASPRCLAVGQFNEDSYPDLVVACHGAARLDVLANQGDGTFVLMTSLSAGTTERPEGVAVADIDNDGDDDVLGTFSDTTVHDVALYRQIAPGSFCYCDYFDTLGVHPMAVVAADFDLDTWVDLATVNMDSSTLSVLQNLSGDSFQTTWVQPLLGPSSDFVALADLDGNHYLDLVCTNDGGNSVSVLLNAWDNPHSYCQSAPNSTGSWGFMNSSGSVSVAQNDFTLEAWGVIPDTNGLFFFGQTPQETPFHLGWLCIKAPVIRLGPVETADQFGSVSRAVDLTATPAWSTYPMLEAGSIWNFQYWYRDPGAAAPKANMTDAWRVVFEP